MAKNAQLELKASATTLATWAPCNVVGEVSGSKRSKDTDEKQVVKVEEGVFLKYQGVLLNDILIRIISGSYINQNTENQPLGTVDDLVCHVSSR